MIVECIYPSGQRIRLEINKDNYVLPISSFLEISDTNGECLYIDGFEAEAHSVPYKGENKLIECGKEKCRIISLGDVAPEDFKIEYHEFANKLKANFVGDAMDEELLFIALNESDEDYGINLCTFNRQIGSIEEDGNLKVMCKYIEYLPNIFYRPKLHLKAISEIRPIDTVTRIGYEAIRHLASHSEHWESRKASGLIPARLLARTLEDNYSIYENIAAKCLVDKLYKYAIDKRDYLKNISMQMPSEESFMSVSDEQKIYFQAREILLKGYSSDDIQYINLILEEQIKQVDYIISKLAECKDTFLYRELKHCKKLYGTLKPTNIFMMDNNYKYVYKLWSLFSDEDYAQSNVEDKEITNEYELYCATLLAFALKHFNLRNIGGDNADIFQYDDYVGGQYSYVDWNIEVRCIKIPELETSGINVSVSTKIRYEIDVKGLILPDPEDCSNIDCLYISGDKLIFTKEPNDKKINDFCNFVRKKANGDKGKEQRLFGDLKKRITDNIIGLVKKESNILFIPLSFKFNDSSIVMDKCLEEMDMQISNIVKQNNISAYYYLTPFRPTDYSEKETYTQLLSVLNYGYAKLDIKQRKSKPLKGILPITINDINSYRRFTKTILMQMIEVDSEQKTCPICGEMLVSRSNSNYCRGCEMQIFMTKCNKCKENFKFTKYRTPKTSNVKGDTINLKVLIKENIEGFKNITAVDEMGNPICPHCGNAQ